MTGGLFMELMNFEKTITQNLSSYSNKLIERLKNVYKTKFYSRIELIDFCAFYGSNDVSIQMYSMDRKGNEAFNIDGEEEGAFGGSLSLIENAEYILDDIWVDFLELLESHDHEIDKIGQKVISEWFIDGWNKAGGKDFRIPAYFCFHDDSKSFDLSKGQWISDNYKWK
jgi:hypothetical protein